MASHTVELESITVDRTDSVVTITLRRPDRLNAIDQHMWDELRDQFGSIGGDPNVRVVVLTGAEGNFCAGADLWPSDRGERPHQLSAMRAVNDVCLKLQRLPQPTIAKVRGVAVGAGLNMALMCDLVVADDTARFSEIFARRGLSIDFGGSWILPRRIGLHRAKELALFADIIDAARAEQIGLVNHVVPVDELDAFVDDWAARLAAGPPIALAMTKKLLDNSFNATLDEALNDEGLSQTVNFSTEDTAEAIRAFVDKREPKFSGR